MWWRNPSLLLLKKKMDTVNKTEKSQAYNKSDDTQESNKTDKVKSIDKSRSTQINDIENTVDKSRSIPRNKLSNIITRMENYREIDIVKEYKNLSDLYLLGDNLAGITSDILCIPHKNKRGKYSRHFDHEKINDSIPNQPKEKGKRKYFN